MPGASRARGLVCEGKKHTSKSPQVQHGQPDIPRAMVLTVSFALSPVTWLFCHRHRRDAKHRRQFSASQGAPEPHDFAVRIDTVRPVARHVHRIPHSRFVTIAIRPLQGGGTRGTMPLIWGL